MTVVDASVWVSVYHAPDLFHDRSMAWLQQQLHAGAILVAPLVVLAELAGPIARQTGDPDQAHQAVQQLRRLPQLYLVPVNEVLATLAAQLAADLRLRGADAVYVALAAQLGLPLVSWDREQIERGGQRIAVARLDGS